MNFNLIKYLACGLIAMAVTSCGGGGGSAGSSSSSTGAGGGTAGGSQITADGSVSIDLLNGAGVSTQSISAVEIAQIKVVVKDSKKSPVVGTIVTFSETGPGLLKFAPASLTAMTDSQGLAVLEVRAADPSKPGATTIAVIATVSGKSIPAVKNLEITNAPMAGTVDPQSLANSINFLSTDPADKAIVLAGSGGNGRSEIGTLKFRVVDKNNTPVKSVVVDFVVNPSADVVLNIASATTDADGVVITSVSSKTVPTAVVVKATVHGKSIASQSDTLKVTTGVGVAAGFEILPLVYNLDGALSGDSTDVTARLVDANSNPVADGVPVVFVATGGKIATSSAGGCNTANGACTVKFEVQEPRPTDGIVTVTGSAKVGDSTTLLRQIKLNMSAAPIGIYAVASGIPATPLTAPATVVLTSCGKSGKSYMVANSLGYSVPSGTSVSVKGDAATGLGASIDSGSTVLDSGNFAPSVFSLILDPGAASNPACSPDGIDFATANVTVSANAPKSMRETKQVIKTTYPAGKLVLLQPNTANVPAAVTLGVCSFQSAKIEAIGSDGLTLPSGSTFFASTQDTSASVTVSTIAPNATDPAPPTNINAVLGTTSNNANRQSIWLRLQAPTAGADRCTTSGTLIQGTFSVDVTIKLADGRANTQSVVITYPKN